MNEKAQTWHYDLVARYWAEYNTDGPEIAYFQRLIERFGQPALDAGCGTGRLLLPFIRAGLDVDGCDVSPDMLALCRETAAEQGLEPRLYAQALHELDLSRSYQTIVACGVFGIGVSREKDAIALQRFYQHLEPGGVLLLDNYIEDGDAEDAQQWKLWRKAARNQYPEPWPDAVGTRKKFAIRRRWYGDEEGGEHFEGSEYQMFARVAAFDPVEPCVTRQMRTVLWRDGQVIYTKDHTLTENIYFRDELRQMLGAAGFVIEAIQGDFEEVEATAEHDVIVYVARKKS